MHNWPTMFTDEINVGPKNNLSKISFWINIDLFTFFYILSLTTFFFDISNKINDWCVETTSMLNKGQFFLLVFSPLTFIIINHEYKDIIFLKDPSLYLSHPKFELVLNG
jgi:hypothetical protein